MKHDDEKHREKYLKFANLLSDISSTTADKCPITYDHIVGLDDLLYAIKDDYGFAYKTGSIYSGIVFKEDCKDDE